MSCELYVVSCKCEVRVAISTYVRTMIVQAKAKKKEKLTDEKAVDLSVGPNLRYCSF